MIRIFNITILLILINVTYAQQANSSFHDGKVWFKIKDEVVLKKKECIKGFNEQSETSTLVSCLMELSVMENTLSSLGIINLKHFSSQKLSPELSRTYELQVPSGTKLDELIRKLILDPAVEYAEKIPVNKKHYSPNDPSYGPGNQWYLYQIDAEQAWNYSQGSSNVVVAIVDDAVDIDHPDISGVLWTNSGEIANNGYDDDNNGYVDDVNGADVVNVNGNPRPSTPTSNYDHGTHVAGCAAAASDNNTGIASIGFGISIMSLRCSDNSGLLSNTYDGVLYAIENGADVINMSYGSNHYSNTSQNLFNWANQNGIVLIASAGNDGSSSPQYPAAYNHVISVAATNGNDAKASFSNYDNGSGWVDLAAPGTSIYSTLPTGSGSYGYKQGTSMSGPIVAGLVGLMLSQ
ncbi:MAG TPA: hypothetical protein EYQ86_01730, partial [Bacteroidetes bacterium]|nr:hypothetical protein [Bacteroidota bacterium]